MTVSKTICPALLMSLVCSLTAAGCGTAPAAAAETPAAEAADAAIMSDAAVSYLGPAGTYTEEAAQFFFPDASAFLPESTVPEAIADVVSGKADYAVIPQENTLGGAVTNYVDALIASEDIFVVGEVILPISQTLMGVPGAATLYGLSVLAENVQITDTNKTRFYVLSASRIESRELTNAVLVAACEAGLIDDIVVAVHNAGLELVTIHDRPKGSYLGDYNYILEVENRDGIREEQLEPVLKFSEVRFLGSFTVREKTK